MPAVKASKHSLGDSFVLKDTDQGRTHEALVFFGNRHATRENLEREFPALRFITIRQTHSDLLIPSPAASHSLTDLAAPVADAQWTVDLNVAACIRTADCVPVLIADLKTGLSLAVHAGWRGVQNQIIVKSIIDLENQGFDFSNAVAFIGPHIGAESFEVGRDVALQLDEAGRKAQEGIHLKNSGLAGDPGGEFRFDSPLLPHEGAAKARVDLLKIVRLQIRSAGIPSSQIHECVTDTFKSPNHESFRRDRENSGRQMSFVAHLR